MRRWRTMTPPAAADPNSLAATSARQATTWPWQSGGCELDLPQATSSRPRTPGTDSA